MKLWVESAHQSFPELSAEVSGDFIGILTTESIFVTIIASNPGESLSPNPQSLFGDALSSLASGASLETVTQSLLAVLPAGAHLPFATLRVCDGSQAGLVECDAPPLFMARRGHLVLLPVIEEEAHGHLIRRCDFELRDGDHLALVSEGYIRAIGWDRRLGWRDIAASVRRLTETRCDAEQLAGALMRLAVRHRGESAIPNAQYPISVLALFVRPMRTATVWSGPPADRALDATVLDRLLDEPDTRIICGDTTAEIAARLLRAELVLEPRPADGWAEVPPTSQLQVPPYAEGVDLVTEGAVTLGKARERMAGVRRARDLLRQEDGATRLARALLTADKIHFLVGLAVNPAQTTADGIPMRRVAIEKLLDDLAARGKIVTVEYF